MLRPRKPRPPQRYLPRRRGDTRRCRPSALYVRGFARELASILQALKAAGATPCRNNRTMNPLTAISKPAAHSHDGDAPRAASRGAQGGARVRNHFPRSILGSLEKTDVFGHPGSNKTGQSTYGSMVVGAWADSMSGAGGTAWRRHRPGHDSSGIGRKTRGQRPLSRLPKRFAQGRQDPAVHGVEIPRSGLAPAAFGDPHERHHWQPALDAYHRMALRLSAEHGPYNRRKEPEAAEGSQAASGNHLRTRSRLGDRIRRSSVDSKDRESEKSDRRWHYRSDPHKVAAKMIEQLG